MATTERLPDPPKEYDSTYVERMINHINLQFRALDPLGIQERLMLDSLTVEPEKIIDGMIVKADGVYWNPDGVNGEGPYMWWAGAWHFLGGGAKPCCPIGRHAIYITAGSMSPSASGGCAALATIPSGAATPDIQTLDFDKDTPEFAQFKIRMPKSWNRGTISFVPVWSHIQTNIADSLGNEATSAFGSVKAVITIPLTGTESTGTVGNVALSQHFTSILYPFEVLDDILVDINPLVDGLLWGIPDDVLDIYATLVDGTLALAIAYQTYNNTTDAAKDEFKINLPSMVDGTLIVVIAYITYNNFVPDEFKVNLATLVDGTLITVIAYITYSNFVADELKVNLPTLVDGTLV